MQFTTFFELLKLYFDLTDGETTFVRYFSVCYIAVFLFDKLYQEEIQ